MHGRRQSTRRGIPGLQTLAVILLVSLGTGPTLAEQPDHASALGQKVDRPSLPDFPYGRGYQTGITHVLRSDGVFWSVLSYRTHPNKRDTEGDIVVLGDGSLLAAWSDFYTHRSDDDAPSRISGRRSTDGGRTWGPMHVVQEPIGSNVMSVSLLRTHRGTVLLTFLAKGGPDGDAIHYVRRSVDDGRTFGSPMAANVGHRRRMPTTIASWSSAIRRVRTVIGVGSCLRAATIPADRASSCTPTMTGGPGGPVGTCRPSPNGVPRISMSRASSS